MNRCWALSLGRKLDDPQGRYRVIIGGRKRYAPDNIRMSMLALQDAADPPSVWEPDRTYHVFIAERNLWARDQYGNRIQGWGQRPERWAVNLSREAHWLELMGRIVEAALAAGYDGVEFDDLHMYPFFQLPAGTWRPRLWREHVLAMQHAGAGPKNCLSGWWRVGYTIPQSFDGYGYAKIEGFRFWPRWWIQGWGGHPPNLKTWETYWQGDEGHLGILGLEAIGVVPLIDAQFDPAWSEAEKLDYAYVAVVTACLADTALVAFHAMKDTRTPIWTEAHDAARALGEPTAGFRLRRTGAWARTYQAGHVVLNPTDRDVIECPAHSARIFLKGREA